MNDDAPFQPDRTLYERWRSRESDPADAPASALDPMLLAAYLEGRLGEDEAAALERQLALDPDALDDLVAWTPVAPEIPSAAFIAAAQGLVGGATILPFAPRPAAAPRRVVTAWAAWGAVAASLVLISLVGFNLGMQTERNFNDVTGVGTSIDILDQSSGLGDGIG
jgi:hypothetical protein